MTEVCKMRAFVSFGTKSRGNASAWEIPETAGFVTGCRSIPLASPSSSPRITYTAF